MNIGIYGYKNIYIADMKRERKLYRYYSIIHQRSRPKIVVRAKTWIERRSRAEVYTQNPKKPSPQTETDTEISAEK